jgi:hypothetical protein
MRIAFKCKFLNFSKHQAIKKKSVEFEACLWEGRGYPVKATNGAVKIDRKALHYFWDSVYNAGTTSFQC